jgi:hypothetical protein
MTNSSNTPGGPIGPTSITPSAGNDLALPPGSGLISKLPGLEQVDTIGLVGRNRLSQALELEEKPDNRYLRLTLYGIGAAFLIFIPWAALTPINEVVHASGEVIPEGNVYTVQHLEGGIIQEIFVAEGSIVKVGDPLLRLDLATGGVNRSELQARLARPLNPIRDGSLLTGDSGIVHARWTITYHVGDAVEYITNVGAKELASRLVRCAMQQGIVQAAARTSSDELLRGMVRRELAVATAQERLDAMRTGIVIDHATILDDDQEFVVRYVAARPRHAKNTFESEYMCRPFPEPQACPNCKEGLLKDVPHRGVLCIGDRSRRVGSCGWRSWDQIPNRR